MSERILRTPEVLERVGVARTTLWRLERSGQFPARRRIAGGLTGWLASEVDAWVQDRPVVGSNDDEPQAA